AASGRRRAGHLRSPRPPARLSHGVSLAGRVALVTGATRGLGRAIAERLVRDGAHVVITGRDEALLAASRAALLDARPTAGQQVVADAGDVSDPDHVARATGAALRVRGRIDVLVCNAGVYGPIGAIEDVDWDEWKRAIEIDLYGVVLLCRAVLPEMRL